MFEEGLELARHINQAALGSASGTLADLTDKEP
jgi:hypothetical protein